MTVSNTFDIELAALLQRFEPTARSRLAREIAQKLRRAQQNRIAAQTAPDGSAFAPRKPQLRRRKGKLRQRMFNKIRSPRYLRAESTAHSAIVRFVGRVQWVARVHHFGLADRVTRLSSIKTQYPARELLGINRSDASIIENLVLDHFSK